MRLFGYESMKDACFLFFIINIIIGKTSISGWFLN